MADIIHTSDQNFKRDVLDAKGYVLVDFWAEWCPPCKMLAPQLEIVAKDLGSDLQIVKLDVDNNKGTAMEYGIMGIPTMILFKDGNKVASTSGFRPASQLSDWLHAQGVGTSGKTSSMATDSVITHVNDGNFDNEVINTKGYVLVDFWAEWCTPCKMLAPEVEKAAIEMKGKVKVTKLNIDDSRMIAGRYGIMSIPTLILFKDGQMVSQQVGFKNKQALLSWLGSVGV